jgi:hypothetical protein
MSRAHWTIFILTVMSLTATCAAEPSVRVRFPLQGYYRPGKYVPVHVITSGLVGPAELRAEGAVPVTVQGPAADAVVPWLAVTSLQQPTWSADGQVGPIGDLRALEEGELSVGVVGADTAGAAAIAADLFPGKRPVAISLDINQPFPGDPVAWEALDVVVADELRHDAPVRELISYGVMLVVRAEAAPRDGWQWQGRPGRWVLSMPRVGPAGAVAPAAYEPTNAWAPGWPAQVRRRAALLILLFVIVALAASLWRRTWQTAMLVVAASVAAAAGFAWWGARQPAVRSAMGSVEVTRGRNVRSDSWVYVRPLRARPMGRAWLTSQKPVFFSATQPRDIDLRLNCNASGRPTGFAWRGEPGQTLAFLVRWTDVMPGPTSGPVHVAPVLPVTSPMLALVREGYLSADAMIVGQIGSGEPAAEEAWAEPWPSVHVLIAGD